MPINDRFCRWDYDSLSFHNIWNEDPLKPSDFFADVDGLNDPMSSPSPYDLENQIPLNDLSSSSISNNVINNIKFEGGTSKANLANPKPNGINNSKNKKSDVETDPNLDSEKRDLFYSDDEIAEAYDIEKSVNTTTKTVPKRFKESFEVTLSTNSQHNRDSEDVNRQIQGSTSSSGTK